MKLDATSFLMLTALALSACPSATPALAPEAPPAPAAVRESAPVMSNELHPQGNLAPPGLLAELPRSAAAFESFIGLKRGDPDARIAELFGAPDSSDPGDTAYRYVSYATAVMIGTDQETDQVGTIDVSVDDLPWLEQRGVRDPRLAMVGMPINKVRALLGEPTRIHAGNYTYEWTDDEGDGVGDVNFICYDFWDDACREVQVQWYYF